jgi:hypothetical protein
MAANRPPFLFAPGISQHGEMLKSAVPKRDTFHEQGIRHQELSNDIKYGVNHTC